jgi:hypothetical protein
MRRNRLRWFGHVNRLENEDGETPLAKKMMFSFISDDKRPSNVGIRKRWESRIMDDMDRLDIRNWRRDTRDREKWRSLINRHVTNGPVQKNIKEIIHGYKIGADNRRTEEAATARGAGPRKVPEVLMKSTIKISNNV